ncbi:hypothetical protein RFI_35891, partial [Reticulomyxa filosa]
YVNKRSYQLIALKLFCYNITLEVDGSGSIIDFLYTFNNSHFCFNSKKWEHVHTKKALVGNEDIDYIGMEYLNDAKSKWNVYGNFEWKDFGPGLKELIHPKDERKTDDAPLVMDQETNQSQSNSNSNEKKDAKEKEKEHLTENLNETQYVENMKQVIEMYENKYRQISIDLIPQFDVCERVFRRHLGALSSVSLR